MRTATTRDQLPPADRLEDRRKGPPLGPISPEIHRARRAALWSLYVNERARQ